METPNGDILGIDPDTEEEQNDAQNRQNKPKGTTVWVIRPQDYIGAEV